MGLERAAWLGNLMLAAVAVVLAWVPVKDDLGKWGTVVIAVLVVVAAIALFPRRRADGSTARLADNFMRGVRTGNRSNVQVARDNAKQTIVSGNDRRKKSKAHHE